MPSPSGAPPLPARSRRARRAPRDRAEHPRRATDFITLDTGACEACWECVEACPNEVLGRVSMLFHKHAKVVDSAACTGCLKCVRVCEAGALTRVEA
jgi:2-oxoglutarate ferredoxin oxidoreductase subunit delta